VSKRLVKKERYTSIITRISTKKVTAHLRRIDSDVDGSAVGLLAGNLVDVDDELLAVDADDLAHVALVVAASDLQPKQLTKTL
jgi:hypothetical protein